MHYDERYVTITLNIELEFEKITVSHASFVKDTASSTIALYKSCR